ncbi:hypothetical protein V496_01316 [Pseudogymnoascus sp. VKM F-4515 (FW-2607)]|nr:hypothetical protein V496_01316 [Pseudogymnoascus sp. VKM F-4515 (FW-2607)]
MSPSNNRHSLYVAGPTPAIPLQDIRKQNEESQAPARSQTTRRARTNLILRIFATILAILVGCAITGSSTYAIARGVQQRVAEYRDTQNTENRGQWIELARLKYDVCYDGCRDCDEPSYTHKACAETAKIEVAGVICDANVMRNWEERYPTACLEALAAIYKRNDIKREESRCSALFLFVIFTVLAGICGGALAHSVFWCCVDRFRSKSNLQANQRNSALPGGNQQNRAPPPPSATRRAGPAPPAAVLWW